MSNKATNREKRQSSATNLRADWQPLDRVVIRWDHPSTGPPELRYRLNHAAIVISSGTSTVTYRHVIIPRVDTSITLSGVSRNDINIFHLNAVYQSSFYSAVFLSGESTQIGDKSINMYVRTYSQIRLRVQQ